MAVQSFLRVLIVEGRDHEDAVGAQILGAPRKLGGGGGAVGSRSDDDGYPAAHGPQDEGDDLVALGGRQSRRFAGGSQHHKGVDALFDLKFKERPQRVVIDDALVKGRDQCSCSTSEHSSGHLIS